jgi:hypothetical protein
MCLCSYLAHISGDTFAVLTITEGLFFNGNIFVINLVSLPLLALRLGEYWFQISLYVSDRNRPLAPILRQRWCSLMYDVYLTCINGDV